jgi:hypothetical protein
MMRVPRRKARADERISAGMIRRVFPAGARKRHQSQLTVEIAAFSRTLFARPITATIEQFPHRADAGFLFPLG